MSKLAVFNPVKNVSNIIKSNDVIIAYYITHTCSKQKGRHDDRFIDTRDVCGCHLKRVNDCNKHEAFVEKKTFLFRSTMLLY